MTVLLEREQAFVEAVRRVGDDVASACADRVDREARFPVETVEALRRERALSALVSVELGGAGLSFSAVAAACFELGRRCGASGMIFAMHQIQVACIVRHLEGSAWFEAYLRDLAGEQRLIASVTSEVGTGGDMGRSIAAVAPSGNGLCAFEKDAPTVSYAEQADDLFVTLRRTPDAEPGDQVIALVRREQTRLEPTGTWDPLGMRGTCSPGYVVRAEFVPEQVLPTPFPRVSAESMVPASHVLWSHVWLGIAADAFERARAWVRAGARRSPGETPHTAGALSRLTAELALLRAEVEAGLREFDAPDEPGRDRLGTVASALRFNSLKIAASEQAVRVCREALGVCGIAGYRNDTPFSVGRHLRDTLSAPLMVANERIHQTNAALLLVAKEV